MIDQQSFDRVWWLVERKLAERCMDYEPKWYREMQMRPKTQDSRGKPDGNAVNAGDE